MFVTLFKTNNFLKKMNAKHLLDLKSFKMSVTVWTPCILSLNYDILHDLGSR